MTDTNTSPSPSEDSSLQAEKSPLVFTSLSVDSTSTPEIASISYLVGDTKIMSAEIQKDILVDENGNIDPMKLTQVLVTPHEPLAILEEVLTLRVTNNTSSESWDAVVSRICSLLGVDPSQVPSSPSPIIAP